jgi:hypothetical protein
MAFSGSKSLLNSRMKSFGRVRLYFRDFMVKVGGDEGGEEGGEGGGIFSLRFDLTRRDKHANTLHKLSLTPMEPLAPLFEGWRSVYVSEAYDKIERCTQRAQNLLNREEPDVIRVKIALDNVQKHCKPLIRDLALMEEVPALWLSSVKGTVIETERDLIKCRDALEDATIEGHISR